MWVTSLVLVNFEICNKVYGNIVELVEVCAIWPGHHNYHKKYILDCQMTIVFLWKFEIWIEFVLVAVFLATVRIK